MATDGRVSVNFWEINSIGVMGPTEEGDCNTLWRETGQYWDDLAGRKLGPEQANQATAEDIEGATEYQVHEKVPIEECLRVTGKQPLDIRWIDINKGDEDNEE